MTRFRVTIERVTRETATMKLEAADEREAGDIVVALAKKHDLEWSKDVTSIEVVGCEEVK